MLNVHFVVMATYIFKTRLPASTVHIYVLKIFIGFVIYNFTLFYCHSKIHAVVLLQSSQNDFLKFLSKKSPLSRFSNQIKCTIQGMVHCTIPSITQYVCGARANIMAILLQNKT